MNAENQNPIAFLIEFLLELIGIDPPSKGYQFVGKLYQDYINRWQVHYKRPGDRFWSVFPLARSQETTQFYLDRWAANPAQFEQECALQAQFEKDCVSKKSTELRPRQQ